LGASEKLIWLFGRSGAGKTTLASKLVDRYRSLGIPCLWLDGDRIREGLSQGLGYTPDDRMENHRRIIEVANIACEQGFQVVVSAIAPKETIRSKVNELAKSSVNWIYVDTDEDTCRQRDTKGLYSMPQNGSVSQFIAPLSTERILLHLNTSSEEIELSKTRVFSVLHLPIY
jgi:adenylylsulfate kinase